MARFEPLAPVDARGVILIDHWWALAMRGLLAIAFGITAFVMPGVTMLALVFVFAVYSIADGSFIIVLAARLARRHMRWGLLLLNGLFGIGLGVVALWWPGVTILAFVFMLAAWAVVSGSLMLGLAFSLPIRHGRALLVFAGGLSLLYGVLLFVSPLVGALVLTWWLGAYALIFGAALLAFAWQLRQKRTHRIEAAASR